MLNFTQISSNPFISSHQSKNIWISFFILFLSTSAFSRPKNSCGYLFLHFYSNPSLTFEVAKDIIIKLVDEKTTDFQGKTSEVMRFIGVLPYNQYQKSQLWEHYTKNLVSLNIHFVSVKRSGLLGEIFYIGHTGEFILIKKDASVYRGYFETDKKNFIFEHPEMPLNIDTANMVKKIKIEEYDGLLNQKKQD